MPNGNSFNSTMILIEEQINSKRFEDLKLGGNYYNKFKEINEEYLIRFIYLENFKKGSKILFFLHTHFFSYKIKNTFFPTK